MLPNQSERGKRRLKLFLILVAVVIAGVVIVATLAGNSSQDEYDSETIQSDMHAEQQAEQAQYEREITRQKFREQITGTTTTDNGNYTATEVTIFETSMDVIVNMFRMMPLLLAVILIVFIIGVYMRFSRTI